jgi:hypothetical protein
MTAVADYLALLPSQHATQPKFTAMLAAVLQPFVDANNALVGALTQYDLDTAVGRQLDVIGQWVGLSRRILAPVAGVYFSFDTAGVGFDQGVWFEPSFSTVGVTTLDDETYRLLLRLKIAANKWDGTQAGSNAVFAVLAPIGLTVRVKDNQNMTVDLLISGTLPSALFLELLKQAYSWFRPAGVSVATVTVS